MSNETQAAYDAGFADGCNEGYADSVRDRATWERAAAAKALEDAAHNRNPMPPSVRAYLRRYADGIKRGEA